MDLAKYHYYTNKDGNLVAVDLVTGDEVVADTSITVTNKHVFSRSLAIKICEKVREGMSIASIGNMPDMPSASVIYSWARAVPDFQTQLDYAREDRAHYFHDKVIAEAEELTEPNMVPVAKARMDAYKWAAEKANAKAYGKQVDKATGPTSVNIIISTGIPEMPLDVEAECVVIPD